MRPGLVVASLLAFTTPLPLLGQGACPAGPATATLFGPPTAPADSGRMYSYTLTAGGNEFFFFKKVGERRSEDYRIFRSTREGDGWSAPEQLQLGVDASDLYPSFSGDGSRMVFSSYRPFPGDTSSRPNAHLWMTTRQGNGWSTPIPITASRLGHYHSGGQQRDDGTLTFRLITPDWRTAADMELPWDGNRFASAMRPAAEKPAVEYWSARAGDSLHVWGAITSRDGFTLVSVSRVSSTGRRAPAQYFITRPRDDGSWSPLVLARAGLDTNAPNFAWFSDDGCWLYFTRDYTDFMRVPVAALVGQG